MKSKKKEEKTTNTTTNKPAAAIMPDEVLPPEQASGVTSLVRNPGDISALDSIEANLRREIDMAAKLDKGSAIVGVKIGLGLMSAKKLLAHGNYEKWIAMKFGEEFSIRKAYYYLKLANAFVKQLPESEKRDTRYLPAPREAGNWLAATNEGSDLYKAVDSFVGDLSITELYAAHGIRAKKEKGGFHPSAKLLEEYVSMKEHKALAGKPFAMWPEDEKKAFMDWHEAQIDADPELRKKMNAEAAWYSIRNAVTDNAKKDKTWAYLSRADMEATQQLLAEVAREIGKALKKD